MSRRQFETYPEWRARREWRRELFWRAVAVVSCLGLLLAIACAGCSS